LVFALAKAKTQPFYGLRGFFLLPKKIHDKAVMHAQFAPIALGMKECNACCRISVFYVDVRSFMPSSLARRIADSIASNTTCRRQDPDSNISIAAAVVPPGEVTFLRNSAKS
jgi:hypothetical protein